MRRSARVHNTFQSEYATLSSVRLFSSSITATGKRQRRSPAGSNATTSRAKYSSPEIGNRLDRFPFAAAFQPVASHVEQTTPVKAVVHFPSCPRIDASLKAVDDSWRCTVSMNFPYQSSARFSGIRSQAPSSEPIRHQSTASRRSSSDIRRIELVPDARTVRLFRHLHPLRTDEGPRLCQPRKESWFGVLGREPLRRELEHLCYPNCQLLRLALTR